MKKPKFVVYKAKDGWRWRLVSLNGRIVADGAEAYTRKSSVHRAIHRLVGLLTPPPPKHTQSPVWTAALARSIRDDLQIMR